VRDELTFILTKRIEEVLTAAFNKDATASTGAERDEPLATRAASQTQ